MSVPLEPDKRERDALNDAVLSYLDAWYQRAAEMPAVGSEIDTETIASLSTPPAEAGRSIHSILDDLDMAGQSGLYHLSGGHMSYIPNAGLYSGALAELLASGLNRYTGVAGAAPGMSAIEHGVVDWMLSLFDMEDAGGGVLLSGGSTANLTGIVAARTAQLGDEFHNGTVYVSSHTHHSVSKAARLAGIRDSQIRVVATDDDLRMRADELQAAIASDRGAGLEPFLIVGSAGTTDTGTVDPLDDLAQVAAETGLWFHVDAAYGGFFQLTDRGATVLSGINRADSIAIDPHKGLSIPFGVGALLVGDKSYLVDANYGRGAYLESDDSYKGLRDISSLGPELSRPNRGLMVWLPLHLHGASAFRDALDLAIDLTEHAYARVATIPGVDARWQPDLSVLAFGFDDDEQGRAALEAVNRDGRVHVSPTTIDNRFILRFAILNRRSNLELVDHAIDIIDHTMRS